MGTARIDKYDPRDGGFRAPLAAALAYTPSNEATNDVGKVWAVGLNASGQVVKGAGATGVLAVIVPTRAMAAGEMIDCMTDGEVVNVNLHNGNAIAAGATVTGVPASGILATTTTGNVRLGWTVAEEAGVSYRGRLVVRVGRSTAVGA